MVIAMKIIDRDLTLKTIVDIKKGTIPISNCRTNSRVSDCFVYVTSGSATYKFGDRILKAEKGSIIFLAYQSTYEIYVTQPDYRFIFVDFFFEESSNTALENDIFCGDSIAMMENVFLKFCRLWSSGTFSDRILCKSLLYQIYSEAAENASYRYILRSKREHINAIIQAIQNSYREADFSLEKLIAANNYSPVHFRRIFHQIYHTSPIKYLTTLRISEAKEQLASTQKPVAQIAEACGFHSAYYFSKKFKEFTNMTPSEYRAFSRQPL